MNYSQVEFEVEDHVAIVKLNRPEKLNAWSDVMAKEVYECMKISAGEDDVRFIVFTGAG
jgi:enoyl-CoA hydratase/carnithine racemase